MSFFTFSLQCGDILTFIVVCVNFIEFKGYTEVFCSM